MNREEAHKLVDWLFDNEHSTSAQPAEEELTEPVEERKLPGGKRVVRTKSSADRVYLIDEEKKTRQWITSPEILESLGFEMGDVGDVDDTELLKYQMASPVYRVES